jgi:hypothetical protein
VEESILEHAAVTVAARELVVAYETRESRAISSCSQMAEMGRANFRWREGTYERTNRSRFNHSGFLGLKVMNLLNRTWATGAMPIGAPG